MVLRLFTLILCVLPFLNGCDWFKQDPDTEEVVVYLNKSGEVVPRASDNNMNLPSDIRSALLKIKRTKALETKNLPGNLKKTGDCFINIQESIARMDAKAFQKARNKQLELGTLTYHGKRESDNKFTLSKTKRCTFENSDDFDMFLAELPEAEDDDDDNDKKDKENEEPKKNKGKDDKK